MDDGLSPKPFPNSAQHANPPRTEEITVAGTSGLIGGLVAGLSISFLIVGLATGLPTFVFLLAGVGAALGLWGVVRSATESRHWDPLVVQFEQTDFALGALSTVTVTRRSRKPIPDQHFHVTHATLKCVEWVRYQVGTDTRTATATVVEDRFAIEGSIQANTFYGTCQLEIPVDRGAPTLGLNDNKISWILEVGLETISTVGGEHDIDLIVLPVLDRRHQRFVDAPRPPGTPNA